MLLRQAISRKPNRCGLALILLFCGLIFSFSLGVSSNNASAADSITVTVSGNPTVTVSPTSEGTFADSGNITIGVTSTAASGYTLAITGSGSTSLVGTSDNTKSIASISSAIDQNTFNTNTSYNNKWGYKPSMHYNTSTEQRASNTNYLPSPTDTADIIDITSDSSSNNYTLSIGARVTSTLGFQTYENSSFMITAVANSSVLDCDSTKLCVEYEGNGLTYDGETLNRVNYNSTGSTETVTKYSHTSNISDDGTQSGSYASNLATKDVITIPGASSLHAKITYGTENNWDMLYVFQGEYTGDISRNMSQSDTGWLYKYMGGNNTTTTVEIDIPGDTATFGFYSDDSSQYYGYYAIITGTASTLERSVASGEYATPTGTNVIFYGWSTTQTTPGGGLLSQVEYIDEADVMDNIPGNEGETKTLYAVWQQGQTITFTMDSNTSSIDIIDSNGTIVKTITASGQTATLLQGDTYTIKPTHTSGYNTNTITKTSGAGTLSGNQFTVGAGSATLSITSRSWDGTMQSFDCSMLANIGDTTNARDTRDNEVYLIGKLADNKCWMLDNLRLDLTDSTILNSLTTTNTHVDSASLTSLKSGNRSAGAQYASSGFATWNSSSSSNVYNQAKANADYKDTTTTTYGAGSGKIGVYYNYCAASAGSYCYDSGTPSSDPDTSTLQDAKYDLCPAGWRMPTSTSSGEYQALYAAYSSDATNFRNALSTPLSGHFSNGSAYSQGSYGRFGSSTYNNGNLMYYLYVYSSYVLPSNDYARNYGYSLRCLLSS